MIVVPWLAGHLTGLLAPKSASKGMLIAVAVTLGLYIYQSFGEMGANQTLASFYVVWAFRSVLWVILGYSAAFLASMRLRGLTFNMPAFLGVRTLKGRLK